MNNDVKNILDDNKLMLHRHPSKESLREYIISRIQSGALAPGDPLVSGKKLSELLGVSMRSVRDVLGQLEEEGWIKRKQRVGTFVAERERLPQRSARAERAVAGKRIVLFQPTPLDGLQDLLFYSEISRPLDDYLMSHGVELEYSPPVGDRATSFVEREAASIDVAIVAWRPELYELVRGSGLPCVGLLELPPVEIKTHFDYVGPDNVGGARLAVEHLASLGHKKICLIQGSSNTSSSERLDGYKKTMDKLGLPIEQGFIEDADWRVQGGYEAMLRILARRHDITAVFCANDLMAFGAIRAIRESGRRVPADISVVGFDDWELAQHSAPPLTTVKVYRNKLGEAAGQMALQLLSGSNRAGNSTRVPVALKVRKSTGPARTE